MVTKLRKIGKAVTVVIKYGIFVFGFVAMLMLLLAFTSVPFWIRYNLGVKYYNTEIQPKTIVLMGGGGFPSKSVLMRMHYTAELSKQFPNAKIVVSIPGSVSDTMSTTFKTAHGLMENCQIDSSRIYFEETGVNTRQQALMVHQMLQAQIIEAPIVLVSSPEHVCRAVKAFRKLGMQHSYAQPTFNKALETNLKFNKEEVVGKDFVPNVGGSITVRYRFWDYLQYEILILREYVALTYYWLNGWI